MSNLKDHISYTNVFQALLIQNWKALKHHLNHVLHLTYVPATNLLEENLDLSIARRKGTWSTHNLPLIYNFLSYHRLSPFYPFVSSISSISIPTNVFEALDHLGWRQVMVDVYGKKSIGCQWVYAIKIWANGQTGSFKARPTCSKRIFPNLWA